MKNYTKLLGKVTLTCNGSHNPNTAYDRLCLVYDKYYRSFISIKEVPANIAITNKAYWQPISVISADGEDLTVDKDLNLKFADKEYNPTIYSGLGRKILRKRWINGRNTLKQNSIDDSNTIYRIQYDYDLNGQTIYIPDNCVLSFEGGKFTNGKVVLNNTLILPQGLDIHNIMNVDVSGTYRDGQLFYDSTKDIMYCVIAGEAKDIMQGGGGGSSELVTNNYTWIRYSMYSDGSNMVAEPTDETEYMGIAANKKEPIPSNNPLEYTWAKIRGSKGERGLQGLQGLAGQNGAKGDKGDPGDVALATYTAFIFKSSEIAPPTPQGGFWDSKAYSFTPPTGWSSTDSELSGVIWMSWGVFLYTGQIDGNWSTPIRITGQNGVNGADGSSIEFIYKLTKNNFDTPTTPYSDPKVEDYVPDGWTDRPTGIDEVMQVEWMCTRTKSTNGDWSEFYGPTIWSKWGADGRDGDGVEYIYQKTVTSIPPVRPTGISQDAEYIPPSAEGEQPWTDNPQGTSESFPYEWVSIRKFKNGAWGEFSQPALWSYHGKDGENGKGIRTMYAKTSSSDTIPPLDKTNIQPGSSWSLTIPNRTKTEVIWGIQGIVTYDNKLEGEWQGPYLVTGLDGKDGENGNIVNYKTYVYKLSNIEPMPPLGNDPHNPGNGWKDYPDSKGQWWQCIGDVNGYTNLVVKWGTVIPLNGKDGDASASTEFRFAKSIGNNTPDLDKTVRYPDGWTIEQPTIDTTINESLWITHAYINADNELSSLWDNPTRISGEMGPQGHDGPTGQPGPAGKDGVSGLPGIDIEVRYCLGTDVTYDGSYNTTQANKRVPDGWTLQLPEPTQEKLYVWSIQTRIHQLGETPSNDDLLQPWSKPIRLNGTNGLNGTDGESPVIADLTNEMESVALNSSGAVPSNISLMTTVSMYYGTMKLNLSSISVQLPTNVTETHNLNTGLITFNIASGKNLSSNQSAIITLKSSYKGIEYTRELTFTIAGVRNGTNGTNGKDGISLIYKGEFTTHPSNPQTGWYYKNTVDRKSYVYQDGTWYTMTVDGIDGQGSIITDLDNEIQSVACDSSGAVTSGLPLSTTFSMYYGTTKLVLDSLTLGTVSGVTATANSSTGLITVSSIAASVEEVVRIPITGKATYEGTQFTRNINFTINKVRPGQDGHDALLYELMPSLSTIKKNAQGTPLESTISCKIKKVDGLSSSILSSIPLGYKLYYSKDNGTETEITSLSSTISTSSITSKLTYSLYYLSNSEFNLRDRETIHVVTDGSDGLDIVWKGELSSPPSYPEKNWTYRDTDDGIIYIYNGSSWQIMTKDGSDGENGAPGANGESVYITYNDSEFQPSTPTGNGTTGGWHTNATTSARWISQKVAASSTSGTWGTPILIKGEDGSDAVLYRLVPSVSVVKKDKTGGYSVNTVSCTRTETVGNNTHVTTVGELKYSLDGKAEVTTSNGTTINVTSFSKYIKFNFYVGGLIVDTETIPLVIDGMDGSDGQDGQVGKKGQIVYPMGIYDVNTTYTTTDDKAPYVFDPSDNNFYVLNAKMDWLGTQQDNRTPSQDYSINHGTYWMLLEAFEAIYAKVGIIANGTIGSFVFNGDYMFSQQGKDADGNFSNNYENFNPNANVDFSNSWTINSNAADDNVIVYTNPNKVLISASTSPSGDTTLVTKNDTKGLKNIVVYLDVLKGTYDGTGTQIRYYTSSNTYVSLNEGSNTLPYVDDTYNVKFVLHKTVSLPALSCTLTVKNEFSPNFVVDGMTGSMQANGALIDNSTLNTVSIQEADITEATINDVVISGKSFQQGQTETVSGVQQTLPVTSNYINLYASSGSTSRGVKLVFMSESFSGRHLQLNKPIRISVSNTGEKTINVACSANPASISTDLDRYAPIRSYGTVSYSNGYPDSATTNSAYSIYLPSFSTCELIFVPEQLYAAEYRGKWYLANGFMYDTVKKTGTGVSYLTQFYVPRNMSAVQEK